MTTSPEPAARTRLAPDERRRQLLGIGLRKLVERPIQAVSVDEVAAEAGISRGLLFHYFPTKAAYHDAVIGAAVRRVRRNIAPDDGATGDEALTQFVERYFAQIERRRDFYLALVFGSGALALGGDRVESLRAAIADQLAERLELGPAALDVVHAWTAYVEDRALQWTADPVSERPRPLSDEVAHCTAALRTLLSLDS
ncbi:TetR/AcrR family transcriptional regulator [Nocardioides speluncae]|uniref:TetR/AcrR family transcriptional regulator n=1 Tax=Nocardioides speluncae TaxID=2670337 RepID=UPI001981711B|nr:TetR/AcrR family transcriptional regulator [Nocardioides speluncae]